MVNHLKNSFGFFLEIGDPNPPQTLRQLRLLDFAIGVRVKLVEYFPELLLLLFGDLRLHHKRHD